MSGTTAAGRDQQRPEPAKAILRLGTRGSTLARMQSQMVADALEKAVEGLQVEVVIVSTTGDRVQDRSLHELGGKGLFTKELEQALLAGEVDFAVHSYKDVPVTMPLVDTDKLVVAAVPAREDAHDVLVASGGVRRLDDVPYGATVGTGASRRRSQILAVRPDLKVEGLRGNVDTRLRKWAAGTYDAIVLAAAGLKRSGLYDDKRMTPIPFDVMLPSAGQGALALQCRADDARTREALARLDDAATHRCVAAERAVVAALDGDCHSPIAALATVEPDGALHLRAAVGGRGGGSNVVRAEAVGVPGDPGSDWRVFGEVIKSLKDQGAAELLAGTWSGRLAHAH